MKWKMMWGIPTGFMGVIENGKLSRKMPDLMTDWESVIRCYESSDLHDEYKRPVVDALNYLRQQFGENWVKSAREQRHPLLTVFGNVVPWSAGLISDQAEMLRTLSNVDGFHILLKKLQDKDGFREDLSVMDAAYRFSTFTKIKSLHPRMEGGEKDIVVELDGHETVIEVTNSNSPLETSEKRTFEAIVTPLEVEGFGPLGITAQGKILKPLSEKRAEEGNKIVRQAIECARRQRSAQHVSMERAFDLTIYPKQEFQDIVYNVEGPPFGDGEERRAIEIDRLYDTIKKKSGQLVEGKPGAVIVYSDPDYFLDKAGEIEFAERLVNDLEEAVYDRERLSFFALILIDIGAGEETKVCRDYLYRDRSEHEMVRERILVITNKYAAHPVDIGILRPLIG